MSSESNIDWIDRRLRRLEDNQPKAYQVRMRAIELVMGTFGIPKDEMDNEFRDRISRAEAISNFILKGPTVPFNEATEEGHMAANFVQAMNWLDEQGISRADEGGDYSIIHRIKLLLATANRTFVAKAERLISETNVIASIGVPTNGISYHIYATQNSEFDAHLVAMDLQDAVWRFRQQNPMATIESIDGREVIGLDEETLYPIFEGDEYTIDPEAGYTLVKSAPWPAEKEE